MTSPLPEVDVVVTVIYRGEQVFLAFNSNWKAFTLPMTKRRRWPYGVESAPGRLEDLVDAAMRNVGECLGITSTVAARPWLGGDTVVERTQSDADGTSKRYLFHVFGFAAESADFAPGVCGQWMRVGEILDEGRRPISPTARFILRRLQAQAKLEGQAFPPK
jgi:hypothetical protein